MCGIAGIAMRPGEAPSRETLVAMGDAMAHRGPDDATVAVWGRVGFSFRRLSIIDVAGGAQPIDNEDGTCHVVLNGEIYNHLELRKDLEGRGHHFRTRSDVEVVVHGYEEFGDDIVKRLRGMFAFALWDDRRQRLLLARDRLGKKPLVYHEAEGRVSFASEFRALLADVRISREADLVAIHHYLTYQYVPAPLTAFKGVCKLPPGHLLVYENGAAQVAPYWRLTCQPQLQIDEADAATEVRRLLRQAVQIRLMSEVPLGAFLSGGIDSSTVVALMSEFGPVKTFSIGFEETDFNEVPYAREVAKRYATDHHEFVVRPVAADVLPTLVEHYGEPFADSSALPTYYLAKLTADHVTVALSGDGGDELFAGYPRYALVGVYKDLARFSLARRLMSLPRHFERFFPPRVRHFLTTTSDSGLESYARMMSYFLPEQKLTIYSEEMRREVASLDSYELLYARHRESDAPDFLGRVLYTDTMTYLPGDLLVKVDIATMSNSLEARTPFLDHHLVEFAARLPTSLKLRGRVGKYLLRRAVADLLPESVLTRRKMGFGVPISAWFRGELRGLLRDTLLSQRAAQRRLFRPEAVKELLDEHDTGRGDHGPRLWALLMLELWWRRFLDQPLQRTPGERPSAATAILDEVRPAASGRG